jgi:hypothetical protein
LSNTFNIPFRPEILENWYKKDEKKIIVSKSETSVKFSIYVMNIEVYKEHTRRRTALLAHDII